MRYVLDRVGPGRHRPATMPARLLAHHHSNKAKTVLWEFNDDRRAEQFAEEMQAGIFSSELEAWRAFEAITGG